MVFLLNDFLYEHQSYRILQERDTIGELGFIFRGSRDIIKPLTIRILHFRYINALKFTKRVIASTKIRL